MDRQGAINTLRWTSGVIMAAGVWSVIAPLALGYTVLEEPLWNDVVVGLAVAILALIRFKVPLGYEAVGWAIVALGVWLVFAPFTLGYTEDTVTGVTAEDATWNDIVVGVVVLGLAAWGVAAANRASAATAVEAVSRESTPGRGE